MSNSLGLYIHIPFCKQKCLYCDFYSYRTDEAEFDRYCAELKKQIKAWADKVNRPLSSVYFGGGTPSVLGAERLADILREIKKEFDIRDNAEITAEVNPESGINLDFDLMCDAGFNRISVGMQSAVERELKALGRIHRAEDARLTVQRARCAGIENISLDLMLGIPFQTADSLKESIDFCCDCGVKHISSYILKIEEGTPFGKMKVIPGLADEDLQADLYLFAVDYLNQKGYEQYEISNFAIKGYESRHNLCYWNCDEYIGIGPSAHSFFDGKRFCCSRSMEDFLNRKTEQLGLGGDEEEYVMLRLRLRDGLVFNDYKTRFNREFDSAKLETIKRYSKLGLMELDESRCYFTPKGFLVSNSIISELM